MSNSVVKFLVRPGCHLCDAVRPVVVEETARRGLPLVEIDIDQDDDLLRDYGLRIPVVLSPGGRVLAEARIDRRRLRRSLRRVG